ncbi:MAG: hypothetical protein WCK70_14785 [Chloroflexales bacterium]
MDVRPDLLSDPQQGGSQNVSSEEEQRFSEWIQKRLSLYQMMEQQVQANIKQTVHFGHEFTKQLEEETERLMARYKRQRSDQIQLRDALRQEVSELRAALADERRIHEVSLAQAQSQAESEIAQAWLQSENEIAQQRAVARAERERLLREAHAERERVLVETRQMAARLADLQRSLGDLLRLTPPSETPPPVAKVDAARPAAPPPSLVSVPDVPVTDVLPVTAADGFSDGVFEVSESENDDEEIDPSSPLDSVLIADTAYEYLVLFKGVQSFVVASDLLDQISLVPDIEDARLVEYERDELTIAVRYGGARSLGILLKEHLAAVAKLVDQYGEKVELVYRAAA